MQSRRHGLHDSPPCVRPISHGIHIIKFAWTKWFVTIAVSRRKISPLCLRFRLSESITFSMKCLGTGRILAIAIDHGKAKCVRDVSHACWHRKWKSADVRFTRHNYFWHKLNRMAMPLSNKLSLATSYGHIIMTQKTSNNLRSIDIRTHLPF